LILDAESIVCFYNGIHIIVKSEYFLTIKNDEPTNHRGLASIQKNYTRIFWWL